MITHDIINMGLQSVKKDLTNPVSVAIIDDAIEDIKKHGELEKEHALTINLFNEANEKLNTLERDVKRYFELDSLPSEELNGYDYDKWSALKDKLKKVGGEDV